MKVNLSLTTKRKRAKAAQNRADTITLSASRSPVERVLVIDIGGRSVKILATGQMQSRSFRSGQALTPGRMRCSDDAVIGGGNVTKPKGPPSHCREGDNAKAFHGGFALWAKPDVLSEFAALSVLMLNE
jgi:hypothetical protein